MRKPKLSPALKQRLAEYNPIGIALTPQDVQDWFDWVWPRYATRGYRRHTRAITSWWSRVKEYEIQAARERAQRLRDEESVAELEAWAEQQRGAIIRRDFAAELVGK